MSRHKLLVLQKIKLYPQVLFFPEGADRISHPYKTAGKIMLLYILSFMLLGSKWEDKRSWTELLQAFLLQAFIFYLLLSFPDIQTLHIFKDLLMKHQPICGFLSVYF
jgi:hypothetical protein